MDKRPTYRPEGPGPEPEIIPPGHADRAGERDGSRIWVTLGQNRFDRIYIAKPGPFGVILAALVLGLVGLTIVVVLLGAFLVWLPVAALVVAGLILSSVLRGYLRRMS